MQVASPTDINAQIAAARALWEQGEVARPEAILTQTRASQPACEDAATLLAEVLRSQGRLSAAANVMLDVCRANGFEPSLCLRCAYFSQQCDRHAVAAQVCAGALARGSVPADLYALAGHVARESGDFAAARAHYLAALEYGIDLDRHHILAALANTQRYADPADPDIARFAAAFGDTRRAVRARASAGFALAKAQADLADYAAAATNLRSANALARSASAWDASAWRSFVDARQQARVASSPVRSDPAFTPVFIVGVPRSGTTLTASLLARATGARDRGELRALRYIAEQLAAGGHLGSPAALAEAAALYRMLAVQDDAPATCYLDQDPMNFRYLDIAAAMFPQAKVIHLRRDRRDTALSLWSQDFAHPDLAFAYDFADIATFMAGHDALMAHWRQNPRIAICELDYEALVADTPTQIERLRAFLGAPVRDGDRDNDSAPVQSASVWQARQPVYLTSVGRWQHYAPFVPELARFDPAG